MKFKKIQNEDVPILKTKLLDSKSLLVDYSLSTLLIYQDKYNFEYSLEDDYLFIKATLPNSSFPYFYPPLGQDINKGLEILNSYIKENNLEFRIFCLTEEQLNKIDKKTLQNLNIFNNRDNYDYVYSIQDLDELKGNKLASKRKFVNNFIKNYDGRYTIEEIKKSDKESLLSYMDTWQNQQENEDQNDLGFEKHVVSKLIDYQEVFDSFGIVIKIDGMVVGFTIGVYFQNEFIQHIEKSTHTIRGLYQMSTHFLSLHLDKNKAKYINKEEDIGLYGLRKAKLSYQPVNLIENYILLDKNIGTPKFSKEYNAKQLSNLFDKSFEDEAFNNFFFSTEEYKNFNITSLIFDNYLTSVKYEKGFTTNFNDNINYLFGLSTDENFKKHGFMGSLIKHEMENNSFLLLENQDLTNFYSSLGFKSYSSLVCTKFISKQKEFVVNSSYQIIELDENSISTLNEIYEDTLGDTKHITRNENYWNSLLKQYKCTDNAVIGLLYENKLVAYAFREIKNNIITEIMGEQKFIDIFLQMIFCKYMINNIQVNFFSKENSNQYFMAYQWEFDEMYINMLFN